MKKPDISEIENKIKKLSSTTSKLNFLLALKKKYVDAPVEAEYGEVENNITENQKTYFLKELYGTDFTPVTMLCIPLDLYNSEFSEGLSDPEFTFWFLKFNAQFVLEVELEQRNWKEKSKSPIAKELASAELKKITDFERKAEEILASGELDIYKETGTTAELFEVKEYLRIKADFYKHNALFSVQAPNNPTIRLYAVHILLKPLIEKHLRSCTGNENRRTLTLKQIALKCFYEGQHVTRDNANAIAEKYGFKSGDKLYQNYLKYYSKTDRLATPETEKKLKNKIDVFEAVIKILPEDYRSKAIDEVETLKSRLGRNDF